MSLRAEHKGNRLDFLKSPILLMLVCAYTYYVLGAYEAEQGGNHRGVLWAALSLAVSLIVGYLFKGGWGVIVIAQVGLFLGIAIVRALREQ